MPRKEKEGGNREENDGGGEKKIISNISAITKPDEVRLLSNLLNQKFRFAPEGEGILTVQGQAGGKHKKKEREGGWHRNATLSTRIINI